LPSISSHPIATRRDSIDHVSWIKAARDDFGEFPENVQRDMLTALTIAAEGEKSDSAKPFKGIDGGVFQIGIRHRGDAFRVI
jgi:phage-related protein